MRPFEPNKILYHPDKIHEWMETGSTVPILMEFDLTNACDNFCDWCFGYHGLDRGDKSTWNVDNFGAKISKEESFDIIEQFNDFGIKSVILTGGGEPLVSKYCMDVVEHVISNGMECALITNGNRLTEEKSHILLKNCTWIRISVDATDADEYLQEHGVKTWDRLLDNIKTLVKIKQEMEYSCTIGIGYLTNGDNDDKIELFAKLGSELGVDYSQFRPMLIGWSSKKSHYKSLLSNSLIRNSQKKYNSNIYKVVSSEHKYNMIDSREIERNYNLCHGESFTSVVAADMKLYICCHMRGIEKYCIGDLRKNTLKEIWKSHQRRESLKNIDVHSSDCPLLCRHDGTNRFLEQFKVLPTHKNYI